MQKWNKIKKEIWLLFYKSLSFSVTFYNLFFYKKAISSFLLLLIHHFASCDSDTNLSKHYQSSLTVFSEYTNVSIDMAIRNIDTGIFQKSDTCFIKNAFLIHQLNSYCFQSFCFNCISELNDISQISTLQFKWFSITTDDFFKIFDSALFFLQMHCFL